MHSLQKRDGNYLKKSYLWIYIKVSFLAISFFILLYCILGTYPVMIVSVLFSDVRLLFLDHIFKLYLAAAVVVVARPYQTRKKEKKKKTKTKVES